MGLYILTHDNLLIVILISNVFCTNHAVLCCIYLLYKYEPNSTLNISFLKAKNKIRNSENSTSECYTVYRVW